VENSIDAGARNIDIETLGGGLELIMVLTMAAAWGAKTQRGLSNAMPPARFPRPRIFSLLEALASEAKHSPALLQLLG